MIPYLTAQLVAILHHVWASRRLHEAVESPTREYDVLDELGPRVARQIHGRTAPELSDERREDERRWRRIEIELICDADFRRLAERALDEFPET